MVTMLTAKSTTNTITPILATNGNCPNHAALLGRVSPDLEGLLSPFQQQHVSTWNLDSFSSLPMLVDEEVTFAPPVDGRVAEP
jgi:hypothetical protein